jgi:hypothetical protein
MMHNWSSWKRFPDVQRGDAVEAPIGPGVYEVRHTVSGRVVAFGSAANVAKALSGLKVNGGMGSNLVQLFRRQPLVPRVFDLEYRTCAASSRTEAKSAAQRLLGLRQTARRKRLGIGFPRRRPS